MGSIPREHTYWQKCITWMHCKSLWIKASAKCINVNVSATYKLISRNVLGLDGSSTQAVNTDVHILFKIIIEYDISVLYSSVTLPLWSCKGWLACLVQSNASWTHVHVYYYKDVTKQWNTKDKNHCTITFQIPQAAQVILLFYDCTYIWG